MQAVTSSGSAEQIAVSSFCTYDLYREYINPKASNKQLLIASRVALFAFMIVQVCLQQYSTPKLNFTILLIMRMTVYRRAQMKTEVQAEQPFPALV